MTSMKKLPPWDRDGARLRKGDVVRIIGVPDLSGMGADCIAESRPVFEYLVNKYKTIRGFDKWGNVEIEFRIPHEGPHSSHTVWIEPFLLKKKMGRKPRLKGSS
jgi:hypothetical protein